MSTLFFEESLSSVTLPEELVTAAINILKSNKQFDLDSECALLFTQKLRELTLEGDVSPMAIVMKVLKLYSEDINALCAKLEADVSLDKRTSNKVDKCLVLEFESLAPLLN